MDIDRPHFRTTTTSSTNDLFICFTSRLSSSSMKLSKSILSPGRAARDAGPASLSSSLSRRLRPNGSLRGGHASPFFNTNGKKRGGAFDNPEPSSPKVTCIGQVRVKTKKKVKQGRGLSTRRSGGGGGGEVSFRKIERQSSVVDDRNLNDGANLQPPLQECLPHRNQRWVHLPISICEGLRTFSCLFSSCSATSEREKSEKENFARWLVSVNDGEGGRRSQIELLVGGGDDEDEAERVCVRRHVFDDIEVKDDRIELKGQSLEREDEGARVSICIPPKNALLLMRCRSDPMKMASFANNREAKNQIEDIEEEEEAAAAAAAYEQINTNNEEKEIDGEGEEIEREELEQIESKKEELDILVIEGAEEALVVQDGGAADEEEEVESNMSSFEALLEQENAEHYEDCCPIQDLEESNIEENNEERTPATPPPPATTADEAAEGQEEKNLELRINSNEDEENKVNQGPLLPECLLLMIREPKLSMEVSKETWVCTTDFSRWMRERQRKAAAKPSSGCERRLSIDSNPKPITSKKDLPLPPRSSCSLPPGAAAASMATMIEQKLVNAVAYEPFVLTRCKSEPMRTAAVKLMPESCFWKNAVSQLEPVGF